MPASLTDDKAAKREGAMDKAKGTLEQKKGEVKKKIGEELDET